MKVIGLRIMLVGRVVYALWYEGKKPEQSSIGAKRCTQIRSSFALKVDEYTYVNGLEARPAITAAE